MITLLCPPRYDGHFVTIGWIEGRQWQVTDWVYGLPKRYSCYETIFQALVDCFEKDFRLATERDRAIFEEDVVLGGMG